MAGHVDSQSKVQQQPKNPDDLFAIFSTAPATEPTKSQDVEASGRNGHKKTNSLFGFDPLLDSEQTKLQDDASKARGKPPRRSKHRASQSLDFRQMAYQLDVETSQSLNKEERNVSLEDSIKESPEQQSVKSKKKSHRKTRSLGIFDLMGSMPKISGSGTNTPPLRSRANSEIDAPVTPPLTSPKGGASNEGTSKNSATAKKSPKPGLMSKISPKPSRAASKQSREGFPTIPTLSKPSPTSFLKDSVQMAERTSEMEPSPHQVSLPTSEEMYMHAKLCALIDTYRDVDPLFDFNMLRYVSPLKLKQFITLGTSPVEGLKEEQKPIVEAMMECSSNVSVEGFFTSEKDDLEVGVFSTPSECVVVYRGSNEQQAKPTKSKHAAVSLDPDNNPGLEVYPPFRDAYFCLESQVYELLDSLMEQNPFLQVVFTGHSFGAALATIGAARFAIARPVQRFSCHVYGSPKVGAAPKFRQEVNSLPNLSLMRVELGGDPIVHGPADAASTIYEHVGHTLAIPVSVLSSKHHNKKDESPVSAYRFDAKKPNGMNFSLMHRKSEHDIQTYVKALEPFATHKLSWVSLYVGMDVGKGVRGKDNEKRLIA